MAATETATGNLTNSGQVTQSLKTVRIVIGDEEVAFCERLRREFQPQRRIEIAGVAHDTDGLIKLSDEHHPHVLLIGYAIRREMDTRRTRKESGPLELIMLDMPEKTKIIESFRLGAKGIVMKESPARTWWKGIGAVVAGQYWLGNESLAVLIQAIRDSPIEARGNKIARHFGLTPREIEIVQRIADGRSNKEVGEDCMIRERTVKHHLTNIFGKVGVSSRLELALFAREHQILAPPQAGEVPGAPALDGMQSARQRPHLAGESDLQAKSRTSKDA